MSPRAPLSPSLSVGPESSQIRGSTGDSIQIAIDALSLRGGGTVKLEPGRYTLTDSIRLRPRIKLIGAGVNETVLTRPSSLAWSPLAADADVGQNEITPEHPERFSPGMGVCIWDALDGWGHSSYPLTITHIEGGILRLHDYLTLDRRAEENGRAVNFFPMILGFEAPDLEVEHLTLDAGTDDPDNILVGMSTAAIYLHRCPDARLRHLVVRGNAGDGICFGKTSLRTQVEDCEVSDNGLKGIHPGSHSARCAVRRCLIHGNASDGLYICWGISHSEFTDNTIHHNGIRDLRSGISIGHKDTDNLIARNHIHDNKKFGICFRQKTEANGAHRCVLSENRIENNGSRSDELTEVKKILHENEAIGCGIHISGITRDIIIENNTIIESRHGEDRTQQHAIVTEEGVHNLVIRGNTITGHPAAPRVDRGVSSQPT